MSVPDEKSKAFFFEQKVKEQESNGTMYSNPDSYLHYLYELLFIYSNLIDSCELSNNIIKKIIDVYNHYFQDKRNEGYILDNIILNSIGQSFESSFSFLGKSIPLIVENALFEVASFYQSVSQFEEAQKYYLMDLNSKERFYGKNDLRVAISLSNLANFISEIDEEKTLGLYRRAVSIKESHLNNDDIDLSISYHNLAISLIQLNFFSEAIDYLKKARKIQKSHSHSSLPITLTNYGKVLYTLGKYNDAIVILKEAISLLENAKERQIDYANALQLLGEVYCALSNYEEASRTISCALSILPKENNDILICQLESHLGNIYRHKGDTQMAIDHLEKTLQNYENIIGFTPPLFQLLNYLGNAYREGGNPNKALDFHERALRLCEQVLFGKDHLILTGILDNLTLDVVVLKSYEQAVAYGKRSLKIKKRILGERFQLMNGLTDEIVQLSLAYSNLSQVSEQKDCLKKAYVIVNSELGIDNPRTLQVKTMLDTIQ